MVPDHTRAQASRCIEMAQQQGNCSHTLQELKLVSDVGLHFRAYEQAASLLFGQAGQAPMMGVVVKRGVEKHMKSEADRLPVPNTWPDNFFFGRIVAALLELGTPNLFRTNTATHLHIKAYRNIYGS